MGAESAIPAAGRAVVGALGAAPAGSARPGTLPRLSSVPAHAPPCSSPSCTGLQVERGAERWQPPRPCKSEEEELVSAPRREVDQDSVFGPVPSREEVVEAISTIQGIFTPFTFQHDAKDQHYSVLEKDKSDLTIDTNPVHSGFGIHNKVMDAFHSLQKNPWIQTMVFSLSSDEAVWDAVMKNKAVIELRESIFTAEKVKSLCSNGGHDLVASILKLVLDFTKAKVIELLNKITEIVNVLLTDDSKSSQMDLLGDAIRSSFMLSIMVFVIVIINRFHTALP